jgi:hypothetical protein
MLRNTLLLIIVASAARTEFMDVKEHIIKLLVACAA